MTDPLQTPIVSAIVSTYNSAEFIRGCIEDLECQTIADQLEIIVIDSASPQNEGEIVRELQERYQNIRYLRTKQRETVYAAWNRGIEMARGRYITNANTDDRHRHDAFELMVKTLDALPDVDLVYADVMITRLPNETFETTTTSDSYTWPAWDRTKLLDEGCFIGPQPMWRHSVHDLYGGFDESYVTSGDYEFWLRISQTSHFQHIAQPLGLYLARPDSIEHANETLKQCENAKIRKLYRDAADQGRLVGLLDQQPLQAALREASCLAQRGKVDQAVQLLISQGIRMAAADPRPYISLAELLIRAGRYQDAFEVLPEMPSDTDQAMKRELEAICCCALGDDVAARQAALEANERPQALVVLGTLAARQGDTVEAERLFRQAVQNDPSCGSGWLSLGMLLWSQGQQADAWQAVLQAVVVDPLNTEATQILRDIAERLGFWSDALRVISQAAQLYPDSRHLALHHIQLLARCGRDIEALDACEAFLVRFSTDEEIVDLAFKLRLLAGLYDQLSEGGQQSISLCMIVKDEESCLARCLASVKPVVHELVVVDTGSSDHTVAIATAFGAKVSKFQWNGSFSDARNFGLDQAGGAWILVLDADEVLSAQDYGAIERLVATAGKQKAFSVLTRNYTAMIQAQGWTANDGRYPAEERADGWQPSKKVRLFPNDERFRFQGEVHEMLEPSLRGAGIKLQPAPFVVHHYGELEQDPVKQLDKKLRYFETGMQKLAQQPDDLAAICELAVQAGELGRFEEGIDLWNRVLRQHHDYVEALFNKGYCLMGLQRYVEALDSSRRALELDPSHKEAAYNYGTCELYVGDPQRALTVIKPITAQFPEYPLLQALLAALCFACDLPVEGQKISSLLKVLRYDFDAYLRGLISALHGLGIITLADSIASKYGGDLPMNSNLV
jgi:glycosyltransferase involved in cell wall biosynthesis/predicted Zn-dependent protease